ncbi:ABC transporter permease [Cryomorphaceae bacterium]|nr:ABC transporter permease [Cryomorphaceae bacterium]
MFGSRIKLAFRHLWKELGFTSINIFGLAIGLAASLAIFIYAGYHFSFDRFHEGSDRIFRVLTIDRALGVSSSAVGITTPAAGPAAFERVSGVEAQVRFMQQGQNLLRAGDQTFFADNFAFVDSNFFSFFNFPLVQGNPETVLREPNKVLLSESLAAKLFPDTDPIGQQIEAAHTADPVQIQGIFEDPPANSHLDFDMVVSILPVASDTNTAQFLQTWTSIAAPTYVRLADASDWERVLADLKEIGRENDYGNEGDNFDLTMQPLLETHMYSTELLFDNHNNRKTDFGQIRNLLLVAIFLLLIAAFNFMNLSTARSGKRAREIGVRKVLGAQRSQLVGQFLLESVLLVFFGFLVALAILELLGEYVGINVPSGFVNYFMGHRELWGYSLSLILILGLLSGLYPAFVLSRFDPVHTLKGNVQSQSSGKWLRRILVTLQFTVSVAVIIGMLIVRQQVAYMNAKDMGFDKDYVLTLNLNSQSAFENAQTLRDELTEVKGVEGVAFTNALPGTGYGRTSITPEGYTGEETWIFSITGVGYRFAEVLGLDLLKGRFFDEEHATDAWEAIVLNEAAVEAIGWDDPIGKTIELGGRPRTVIGVIKNFHYVGLRYPIEPLMLAPLQNAGGTIAVKLKADQASAAIASIGEVWKEVNPSDPFEYEFFDEEFQQLFTDDERFAQVLSSFNWLAILIACLGLLGLTAYTVQQKTKELGVRKVLGASMFQMLLVLSREFWWMLLVANIIAIPISYYYMSRWLSEFVYRIDLNFWPFLVAVVASFMVALVTILTQALRAERIDAVKALKYE